jgi:predicted nucleic acid-binding protein
MKALIDTNVLLDVFLARPKLCDASTAIWSMAEKEKIQAYVSAISFNNVHYIATRYHSREHGDKAVAAMRDCFKCIDQTIQIINQSIDAKWKDFEDAIQYFSAIHSDIDIIITRNVADFPKEGIAIMTPEDFISFAESKQFDHE